MPDQPPLHVQTPAEHVPWPLQVLPVHGSGRAGVGTPGNKKEKQTPPGRLYPAPLNSTPTMCVCAAEGTPILVYLLTSLPPATFPVKGPYGAAACCHLFKWISDTLQRLHSSR